MQQHWGAVLFGTEFFSGGQPVAITTGYYLPVVAAAVIGTILLGRRLVPPEKPILTLVPASDADAAATLAKAKRPSASGERESNRQNLLDHFNVEHSFARTYVTVLSLVDALGLGIYAVIGAQKSLYFGLPLTAAVLVGAVNAAGGGLLRDVLTREVPLLFKPGQFYALTAVVGSVVFVALALWGRMDVQHAAFYAIGATFLLRLLAIRFDWRSPSLRWHENDT